MTDWFGRWDVFFAVCLFLLLLLVGARWKRRNRAPRGEDGVPLTTAEQVERLFSAESRLKRRYLKPDARWKAAAK